MVTKMVVDFKFLYFTYNVYGENVILNFFKYLYKALKSSIEPKKLTCS